MSLKMNESPYQRSPRTTFRIMLELTAALLVVWLAAVIFNFTRSPELGLRAILLMVVAVVFSAFIDAVVALIRHKKGQDIVKEVIDGVVHNYSYVTAIIFTLCCPVYVSYYVIIIGCLFSTGIKHCFGGFGKNIFNPAIIGRIVTGYFFAGAFQVPQKYIDADLISSSTVTTQYNALSGTTSTWLSGSLPEGFNIGQLLLGNYDGAMGETFTLLILALGIFLMVRNVINWRSSVFYLGTVAVTAFFIALFVDGLNPATYVIYHLALGGLMFGAIFMITDPVTSCTSPFGKALVGVIAGILTVLFRIDSKNPEGVMYSIAIINILAPMIDRMITGRTTDGHAKKWGTIGGLLVASVVINTAISVGNVKGNEQQPSSSTVTLTPEQQLFGIEGATYEKATLGSLPADSNIKNVYIASVNGTETALSYELTTSHTWATDHGEATMNPTLAISFNLSDDKVLAVNVVDGGSNKSYADKGIEFGNKLVNLDVSVLAQMTSTSHDGLDFVAGASVSSEQLLTLAVEAANQYINVDKVSYNMGYGASFEEVTLSALPTETNIQKVYLGKVNGLTKVVSYELTKFVSWDTGHGDAEFNAVAYVTISLDNDTVAAVKVINGGSMDNYSNKANTVASKLVGLEASVVAAMSKSSHDGVDFEANATYSSETVLELAVEACAQYANDKDTARFGYAATYTPSTGTLPADTNIKNAYLGSVEGTVKVVAYELEKFVSWDTGHGTAEFTAKMTVTVDVTNDTIISISLSNCGTAANFITKSETVAARLLGLDANVVATMTSASHDGVDFEANATYSSETALLLTVEACAQYVNVDKALVNGGGL